MRSDDLYKPFENIPTRRGRGGNYPYIRWQDVADRMNKIFGTSWSSMVMSQDIINNNVIVRLRVSISDENGRELSYQEGFGGAPSNENAEAGNSHKAAYSKALKDACKKWGIGLFLDEEADTPSDMEGFNQPAQGLSQPQSMPQGYTGKEYGVPEPGFPSMPPFSTDGQGLQAPPGMNMKPHTAPLPTPPGVSIPAPQHNTQPMNTALPKVNMDLPMSKVPNINIGGIEYISDVQKTALNSILQIPGVEYLALAKEAFDINGVVVEPIPAPDSLTYDQAVHVVKHGNQKYRRR